MKEFTLSNGVKIPAIGFGTWIAVKEDPGIVSKAIEEGYISRIVDNQDRRKYQLKLTPEGTACVDDILGRLQAWQDEVLGKLDESERKHFLELLGQVYENAEALDR